MHDALEDVCDRLLRTDSLPDAGGTPATLIITIDIEDLLNGTGYGITSDGTLIRTEQVRDLTDQTEVYLRVPGPHRCPPRTSAGPGASPPAANQPR